MRLKRDGFSIEAAKAKGRELPDWYVDAPELPYGGEFFFQAFLDLSTCRLVEGGPIPWTAITDYADRLGFDEAATGILNTCIRQMDTTQLNWMDAEAKRRRASANSPV